MAAKITAKTAEEFEPHQFLTEASAIGLPPGKWPDLIKTDLGNGLPFRLVRPTFSSDGELESVLYSQINGCIAIRVYND